MPEVQTLRKPLSAYLDQLDEIGRGQIANIDALVSGVTYDSRQVEPGSIFVAISGEFADGHDYIRQAFERGAVLAVGSKPVNEIGRELPYVQVSHGQAGLATAAAVYYDFPARKLVMIGVTGTDGKTTTCNLIYGILKEAGLACGMVSTVNAMIGDEALDTGFHVTTPPATDVQRYLAMMVEKGITHVVMEATSHGLDQRRVDECYFDLGVVTNITHEHLDYHKTYEHYLNSKARLFTSLSHGFAKPTEVAPLAILNRDDRSYAKLQPMIKADVRTYGIDRPADVLASQTAFCKDGTTFHVTTADGVHEIRTPLLGEYNVYNTLAAVTCARHLAIDWTLIQSALLHAPLVPGRLEVIDLGQDFTAIVDFAHTPNSLRTVLETVRPMTNGKLICVFGSAGLRDREKRRDMPMHAVCLADFTILTAEDPRTEKLGDILAEMAAAATEQGAMEGRDFVRVPDRREALRKAVSLAAPGDLVIALGKGHEQSMCFGTTEYEWDDRQAMRAAIAERLGLEGYPMPFLPAWE